MNSKRSLIYMVLVSFALPGCATVYLHHEADAKAMAEAKEGLKAARTAHLAAFEDHEKYLVTAFKAERDALTGLELARRDLEIAAALDGLRKSEAQALSNLQEGLYFRRLSAIEPALAPGPSQALVDHHLLERLNAVTFQSQSVAKFARNFEDDVATFERVSGSAKGPSCTQGKLDPAQPPAGIPSDAKDTFDSLVGICQSLHDARVSLENKRNFVVGSSGRQLPAWLAVMAGNNARVVELSEGGELKKTVLQAARLQELSEAQNALAANADRHRRSLEQYLKCLQDQANAPDLAGEIASATQELTDFIRWLATIDEDTVQTAQPEPRKPAAKECKLSSGATLARPPPVQTLRELAALGEIEAGEPSLSQIQDLLKQLSAFKPTRSLVGALQETAQSIRERQLYKILDAIAKSSAGTAPTDRTAKIAVSSLKLVSLIRDLDPERLPNTSAVLIDLADAQMKASNARVEAERLEKLTTLANLKLTALRNEILILQTGVDQVARGRAKPFDTLLRAYNESWMRGRLQQSLLEHDMLNLEYTAWLERQRTATEATYAILDPAFTELGAYADGGFKPEDIARYLGVLGIGAIAVGTN
jgi:hypothetical protein